MGHHYFNGGDEYITGTSMVTCGHSMMGNNNENLQHNVCNNFNHGFDPSSGAGSPLAESRWQAAYDQGKTPYWLYGTPDNDDYVGFDFDGLVGYVP